jgi:RND family efflux transporter MFP subunit
MKSRFTIIALMALAGFTACNTNNSNFDTEVAVPVTVEELKLQSIQQVLQTTGVVSASREISLKTEMAGTYELQNNPRTGKPYRMGDEVQKGEVIIRLIDREYENRTNIEGAKLDLDISSMENQKQKALYEKGGVTLRELVNSEKSLVTAKQNYENAEISLAKMAIKAPFAGVITKLPYFSQGNRVEQTTEVVAIMNYTEMVLDLSFSENLLGQMKVTQPVRLMNYSIVGDTLTGAITELSPAIDKDARTFAGRVKILNPKGVLRPGMFVKCDIELDKKDSTIVISKDIILTEGGRKVVFVAEREVARRREVRTGLENQNTIEVVDGIKKGERLIIKGYETLKDRSKIKVIQ